MAPPPQRPDLLAGLALAADGSGPLLQRDYWGVIAGCRLTPEEVADEVARRFVELPPPALVRFRRAGGGEEPLTVGDEMEVDIRLAGSFRVRVIHRDAQSLTVGTVAGHPEAGRITFGAYENRVGEVVFHIRSRARSGSSTLRAGFLAAGEPMQTNTWTDFVNRLAARVGDGVLGSIRASSRVVEDVDDDRRAGPTFFARPAAEAEAAPVAAAAAREEAPTRAVPEMRLLRGWSEAELAERLARLGSRERNFDPDEAAMPDAAGWRPVASESLLAREAPGPPEPDGAYVRARRAVADFALSDPRSVEAHYDREGPLLGRRMLLELKVLGLRFLGATVVAAVEEDEADGRTRFAYRYDTLAGHLERGLEWFEVSKDHATGEVRFAIRARWRPGDFPNAWSRAGFVVLGPLYQEMWHRRAHRRVRDRAADRAPLPRRGRLPRHGGPLEGGREVTFARARRRSTAGPGVALATAAAVGALTGVRSTSGVALLALARAASGRTAGSGLADRALHQPGAAVLLPLAAAGEAVADKLPAMPPRTALLPLAGRAALGALCGAAVAQRHGRAPWGAALAAAGAAVAAAFLATGARAALARREALPDPLAGLAEDAIVAAAAAALWNRVG